MLSFFLKLASGHVRRHRLEAMLCLIGVALGVAVVVAIDSAVNASVQSFSGAVNSMAERSTHSIFAETGNVRDDIYIDLLKKKLPVPLAPMIDRGILVSTQSQKEILGRLIGIDVFSERSLRSFTKVNKSLDEDAFKKFLTEPGQVILVNELARRLNAKTGDELKITIGGKRVVAHVVGIVEPVGVARSQLTDIIIADLATAQELTGNLGEIDRIDTVITSSEQEKAVTAALPTGYVLRSTQQRAESLEQLIQSYRLNLHALSLMASFVAVFIVYNSMLISVKQRQKTLGILRCLGSSKSQMAGLYLSEAVIISVIGGILGVLGGYALSRVLVGYVSTTINDLYAAVRPGTVKLDSAMWGKGLSIAVVSSFIGAIVPLVQASQTPPVNAVRFASTGGRSHRKAAAMLVCGIALLFVSYIIYLLPGESPVAGFVIALIVSLGFALICPWITHVGCMFVDKVARMLQLLPMRMAATGISRSLGITGVAVAATMLAMSMNIGVRTMVGSFRTSLNDWMGERFAADVFVAPELLVNHKIDATLDPSAIAWVSQQSEVERVMTNRVQDVPIGGKPTMLNGTDVVQVLRTLPMKSLAKSRAAFDPDQDVLVSEPLAGRTKVRAGDELQMQTPTGPHRYHIFGIFFDFGTERGQVMLDRKIVQRDWKDEQINSLSVMLKPGTDRQTIAAKWAEKLRQNYPVEIHSFEFIKSEAMRVFDRTFKVTEVLTWLSGGVAFCGMAGSLLALALARQRDYNILAAVGMSGKQTATWVTAQGLIIAWASALIAAASGTILAFVLAYVIQYRSFGWSIPAHPAPRFWIENLLLATVAAVVAAIYPIVRLRSVPPAVSLRPE